MTLLLATASGRSAVASVVSLVDRHVRRGVLETARHADQLVVWDATSRWVHAYDDGEVVAVVDGFLYGDEVAPGNPAEQVVALYRRLGARLCVDLLGDFVLVVLDRRSATVHVGRDPVGVRPWYRASSGGNHAGSSDLATLSLLPWVSTDVDEAKAVEYLAGVPQSRGQTILQGVVTLPPGHTWTVDRHGGATTRRHHAWQLNLREHLSWEEAAEHCRELLDVAVVSRIDSGFSATSEVSGGLDSSAVAGTLVHLGRPDVIGARLLFHGPAADERRYSDAVAERWGFPLLSAAPWLPTHEDLTEMSRHLHRPVPDPNFTMFLSLHHALLEAGRHDSMTGLGGDDAFVAVRSAARAVSVVQMGRRDVAADLLRSNRRPPALWKNVIRPTLSYFSPVHRGGRPVWVTRRAARSADLRAVLQQRPQAVTGVAAVDERLAGMTTGYNAWVLEDRAIVNDMSGRRETHPFLDPRFVTGTYALDPWWPTRDGHSRALEVEAYKDRLPRIVATRRSKAEFSEVAWPMLDDSLLDSVAKGPLRGLGWLDDSGFQGVVGAAREGRAWAALPLSRCIALDRWLRDR